MMVFFRKLPLGVDEAELKDWVTEALKGGWFSRSGKIINISIIEQRNPSRNIIDRHAIVTIEPDSAAQRVITKLSYKLYQGKYLQVRRYYIRNPANDPRLKNKHTHKIFENRRKGERRQSVVVVIKNCSNLISPNT